MQTSHNSHNMVAFQTPSVIIFVVIQVQSSKTQKSKFIKNKNQNYKIGILYEGQP